MTKRVAEGDKDSDEEVDNSPLSPLENEIKDLKKQVRKLQDDLHQLQGWQQRVIGGMAVLITLLGLVGIIVSIYNGKR